jgi:hypothetical protein
MNHKNILSVILLDLVVMVLALGLIISRYSSLMNMALMPVHAEAAGSNSSVSEPQRGAGTAAPAPPPQQEFDSAISSTDQPADAPRNIGFSYRSSKARKIDVIGDFNGWIPNPMARGNDFKWSVSILIAPGEYAYNFVVDGKPIRDPYNMKSCDVGRGFPNSLLKVKSRADEKKKSE